MNFIGEEMLGAVLPLEAVEGISRRNSQSNKIYFEFLLQKNVPSLQQIFPFCNHLIMDNSISTSGCDYARSAVSYCNLSPFPDPLPSEYQVCELIKAN